MSSPTTARVLWPILLIEDESSVSAFVQAALNRRGYTVVQAANGYDGLRHLAQGRFAGVISDIRMPGDLNGGDVHRWIRENRPELCGKIILISGDTANSETQELLTKSATPCIEKPFRVQELIAIVETTFGKP